MHSIHLYEVRPRKDHCGVDLISDALPFGPFLKSSASASDADSAAKIASLHSFNNLPAMNNPATHTTIQIAIATPMWSVVAPTIRKGNRVRTNPGCVPNRIMKKPFTSLQCQFQALLRFAIILLR